MSLRRAAPAGLVDAACASLATFGVGLYAARTLAPATLGVYALFFSAFVAASVVPTHLAFVPAQVRSLQHPAARRTRLLVPSLRAAALPLFLSAIVAAVAPVAVTAGAGASTLVPLTVTAGLCTAVSPVQDQVRRMLHAAERSWSAAAVSGVQLSSVVLGVPVLAATGVAGTWVPFGVLSFANSVSLFAGIAMAHAGSRETQSVRLDAAELFRSGRWLTLGAAVPWGANFLAGAVVAQLAGAAALGYAEAARVASQPLLVLSTGLNTVIAPRLMAAAARGARDEVSRLRRPFTLLLFVAAGGYLLAFGWEWTLNPIARLLPLAYAVPGLLGLSIVAQLLAGHWMPYGAEMIGMRQERRLVRVAAMSSVCHCLVATLAWAIGPFAKPAGLAVESGVKIQLAQRLPGDSREERHENPHRST